jgi:hypothetical protein
LCHMCVFMLALQLLSLPAQHTSDNDTAPQNTLEIITLISLQNFVMINGGVKVMLPAFWSFVLDKAVQSASCTNLMTCRRTDLGTNCTWH